MNMARRHNHPTINFLVLCGTAGLREFHSGLDCRLISRVIEVAAWCICFPIEVVQNERRTPKHVPNVRKSLYYSRSSQKDFLGDPECTACCAVVEVSSDFIPATLALVVVAAARGNTVDPVEKGCERRYSSYSLQVLRV